MVISKQISNGVVAFVLKGYPRLSETFIAQEILALEKRGLDICLFSLRHPGDKTVHPIHHEIAAKTIYLPEYLYQEPLRVIKCWLAQRRRHGFGAAFNIWLKDVVRDPTPNRFRRFGQALVMAAEMPQEVKCIHAHFMHTPASVARYAAIILGLPWSCSAHAKDIWTSPQWEKREKLKDCTWLVTCTQANVDHLSALVPELENIELVYHGLDFSRFPPPTTRRSHHDGSETQYPLTVLSVGRAVEKKGYRYLLDALAGLPENLHWRFVHIGGGTMLDDLKNRAQKLGIDKRINWLGPLTQDQVLEHYRAADLFVLASCTGNDGDRDGLANVLMEAQSQGLACISTYAGAASELITDDKNGILLAPADTAALTLALKRLISDAPLRQRLGSAGMENVHSRFSLENAIDRLAAKFVLR